MGALADRSAESMASVRSVVVSAVANLVVAMAIIATAALVLALAVTLALGIEIVPTAGKPTPAAAALISEGITW